MKEMDEKKKGGAGSRQPKCLEDGPCAVCRGEQRSRLRSGFRFGALCKAVQDVSFLSKQHKNLLTHAGCFVFSRLPRFSGACS